MTRQELTKEVAEKVMKWWDVRLVTTGIGMPQLQGKRHEDYGNPEARYYVIPEYAFNEKDATKVLDKLKADVVETNRIEVSKTEVILRFGSPNGRRVSGVSDSRPEAICVAALKAIE